MDINVSTVRRLLKEGTEEEIAQLQGQIATVQKQIEDRTRPMRDKIASLQKILTQKQRELGSQAQTQTQQQPQTQTQPTQPANTSPAGSRF